MKLIKKILFFTAPFYLLVAIFRNFLFDSKILKSNNFNTPIIGIGNLSSGGTGKSPMIEYIIELIISKKKIATLSRGYGRKSSGFLLANEKSNATSIGDEPMQFKNKFKDLIVAVDENRVRGIKHLFSLKHKPQVILLDDCYQHRYVSPGLLILLTDYNNIFYEDKILPIGNLREPASSYKRADIIIVTKCPDRIIDKQKKILNINPLSFQKVFFSTINYSDHVISNSTKIVFKKYIEKKFTLLTGIANSDNLINYLNNNECEFDHISFSDHHNYTDDEIIKINKLDRILTTEKDFMKIKNKISSQKLFYLPITTKIDGDIEFDKIIREYVKA